MMVLRLIDRLHFIPLIALGAISTALAGLNIWGFLSQHHALFHWRANGQLFGPYLWCPAPLPPMTKAATTVWWL
jgi:hypothetical protein